MQPADRAASECLRPSVRSGGVGTSTRSFGTSRREGHDASSFYGRGLAAAAFSDDATVADVPRRNLDRIYHHSSEAMAELPDNSVGLMVTSPPYHAGKDYDSDVSYPEFLELLGAVFAEVHRVLELAQPLPWAQQLVVEALERRRRGPQAHEGVVGVDGGRHHRVLPHAAR